MALAIAAVLFAVFFFDVLIGALAGASMLNDVQEMLVLFASTIAFVVVILMRESQSKDTSNDS